MHSPIGINKIWVRHLVLILEYLYFPFYEQSNCISIDLHVVGQIRAAIRIFGFLSPNDGTDGVFRIDFSYKIKEYNRLLLSSSVFVQESFVKQDQIF